MVALRAVVPGFAAAVYATVPEPLPLPEVTVNQLALLVACQEQPAPAFTLKVLLVPAAGTVVLVGDSVNVQEMVPDCVTVNVTSSAVGVLPRALVSWIVILPVRRVGELFSPAE